RVLPVSLHGAAVRAADPVRGVHRSRAARLDVHRARAVRLVAHRQPGGRGRRLGRRSALVLGDLVERGLGQRPGHAHRQGLLDVRALHELLEGAGRFDGHPLLRVLLDVLHDIDAPLARVAALAGTAVTALKNYGALVLNVAGLGAALAMALVVSY